MASLTTDTTSKPGDTHYEFKGKGFNGEHQFEKMAQRAGERVGAVASDMASTAADSLQSSRDYVRENPVKGVAMAAAAGLVAGSLLTMAMGSRRA